MNPKLSIVIPAYNEEKYLGATLESLKKLTISHEIIVADDKSTDATVVLAKSYGVRVVSPETKHATIGSNRNFGARSATGDFIVFTDSSCVILDPDTFFTRALADFENDPKLVALTTRLKVMPGLETWGDRIMYPIFNWVQYIKNDILHIGEAPGKFQMIKRDAYEKVGGYRGDLVSSEDAELFQRLAKIGRTSCDMSLTVYHSGRRAHALGWPKLLYIWMEERTYALFTGRTMATNWDRWWEPGARPRK